MAGTMQQKTSPGLRTVSLCAFLTPMCLHTPYQPLLPFALFKCWYASSTSTSARSTCLTNSTQLQQPNPEPSTQTMLPPSHRIWRICIILQVLSTLVIAPSMVPIRRPPERQLINIYYPNATECNDDHHIMVQCNATQVRWPSLNQSTKDHANIIRR